MPLIALAVGAYNAGLLAGFAGAGRPAALLCAFAALAAAGYRRFDRVGLVLVAVVGILAAQASLGRDALCRAALLATGRATLVLADSVFPGGYSRGAIRGCNQTVGVQVAHGRAALGASVQAIGHPVAARNRLMLQRATVKQVASPTIFMSLRTHATHAIDATFPRDAPLVRTLLVADGRELPLEVRDRFAAAGLAHMLSISGLHIGLIALLLELLLSTFAVAQARASTITFAIVACYVAMLGFPAPAMRAAAMLGVRAYCRARQRPTSPWAVLAIGALHPVWSPVVVTQAGYQLSIVGVAALIAAAALTRRLRLYRLGGAGHVVMKSLIATTLACIATAPLAAQAFGRVSLVGPLTNLIAGPMLAVIQPVLLLGLATSWLPAVGRFVGDAAHPLLVGLNAVAATAAGLPGASVHVQPTPPQTAIALVAAAATLGACASRHWARPALLAATAGAVLACLPLEPSGSGLTELHVLDVGQGDAIALRTPHGSWVLVDAGGAWAHGDEGRATVVPYIGRRGGPLDLFILSHPHTDHVGGAASVFDALRPRRFIDGAFPGPARPYRSALRAAERDGTRWTRAHPGDSLVVDGVTLTILAPDSAWTATLADPNLASVVVRVSVGEVRMLLTGDAEAAEERWMLAHDGPDALSADVLKVGHHGSNTSTTPEFLAAVAPSIAIISVGAGNHYGLPDAPVLRALSRSGAQVLRTDKVGTVVLRTDGRRVWADTGHPY